MTVWSRSSTRRSRTTNASDHRHRRGPSRPPDSPCSDLSRRGTPVGHSQDGGPCRGPDAPHRRDRSTPTCTLTPRERILGCRGSAGTRRASPRWTSVLPQADASTACRQGRVRAALPLRRNRRRPLRPRTRGNVCVRVKASTGRPRHPSSEVVREGTGSCGDYLCLLVPRPSTDQMLANGSCTRIPRFNELPWFCCLSAPCDESKKHGLWGTDACQVSGGCRSSAVVDGLEANAQRVPTGE